MVRARASPYCLAVMALVACCLSIAPEQESKTWLESLQHCQKQGRHLATLQNDTSRPSRHGTFWVGALVSLTPWVWSGGDPLYRYEGCRREVESSGEDLGVANEAGECFHRCPAGTHFVALKGTKCHCLQSRGETNGTNCGKTCLRDPYNSCGGENSYSVYSLNLWNKDSNTRVHMNWTRGHETTASFATPSNNLWWIVPTPSFANRINYCYHPGNSKTPESLWHVSGETSFKESACKPDPYKDVVFSSNSSTSLRLLNRRPGVVEEGWTFLSRNLLERWTDGGRADGFPVVNEMKPGPLCGSLTWDGATPIFNWELCNITLPFLCSPAPPGKPSQSEASGIDITYVAIAGAGGVVVVTAVLISFCLCRKRTGRMSSGSKTGKQMAIQQGHVSSAANVTGDRDGGNYDVMAPDGAVRTVYMNAQAGSSTKQIELVDDEFEGNYACVDAPSKVNALPVQKEAGSSTKQIELAEDELEGNYACVDEPPKAKALPVQKEAESASSPSPAPAADEADSCMYAVVQKPTYQNAPARQETEPEKAAPPLNAQEVKPLEELYACVKK